MGGPPPPALFNYAFKHLHLRSFLPSLPSYPAFLPSLLSPSLLLFLSSYYLPTTYLPAFLPCLPTFPPVSLSSSLPIFVLPPYYLSSCLVTLPTTTSTRPPSHPQPQLASPPTIKSPLRGSPPCTPPTWSVVPLL